MFVNPTCTERSRSGFTLIELLVTISILAVLSTIGMLMYQGVLSKTRDATRKSDLNKLASALEIYYQRQRNNKFPDTPTNNSIPNDLAADLSDNTIPSDPQSTNSQYYYTSNGQSFTLCAKLENPEASNPAPSSCPNNYNYGVIPD